MSEIKYPRMHTFPVSSEVQRSDGHLYVKTSDKKVPWIRKQRLIAALKIEKRELDSKDRVFLKDGNPDNLSLDNIVCIRFSGVSYRLKQSRVRFIPNFQKAAMKITPYAAKTKLHIAA